MMRVFFLIIHSVYFYILTTLLIQFQNLGVNSPPPSFPLWKFTVSLFITKIALLYLLHLSLQAPLVAERFCTQNWQTGSAGFNPRPLLSMQPYGVFCAFLRNSYKYRLVSFRKTPRRALHLQAQVRSETIGLKTKNQQTNLSNMLLQCADVKQFYNINCLIIENLNNYDIDNLWKSSQFTFWFIHKLNL